MIILLAKEGKFPMGSDFPIFTLPLDMNGATSQSLEDYQWWAYSSDFKKWLAKNPRQWVADSEDMSKYSEMTQLIKEHFGGTSFESPESGRVSNFSNYFSDTDTVYEATQAEADISEKTVKFHFAYNRLLAEGKLDTEYSVAEQKEGEDVAVFLTVEDESGEDQASTMDAYKMSPVKNGNPEAKFKLFEIKDRKLNGPLDKNDTGPNIVQDAIKYGMQTAAYSAAALALWTGAKYLGGAIAMRKSWKVLNKIAGKGAPAPAPAAGAANASKFWSATKTGVKGLYRNVKDMAVLKNTRGVASSVTRGVKGAKAAVTLGKQGTKGAIKAFGKGLTRGVSKAGTKAIPFVGEVLMVIDAIGSTWNWYSGNQAPRYGQVDYFAKESFDPKEIKIGVPITICWSQPAGGWGGTAVSFLYSNETRTTMELVKVAEREDKSIFILTQINAKEVQKQISKSDVTLLSFDNSDVVERGWIDNEDLDFEMASYTQDLAAIFNYQGSCPWNELESAYDEASGSLLISNPNAPDDYEFHFSDSEDEVINVVGKKLTTEDLQKYSDADLNRIFGIDTSTEGTEKSNVEIAEYKEKNKEAEVVSDSINNSSYSGMQLSESDRMIITKFSDFSRSGDIIETVYEAGEAKVGGMELSPDQKSGPAEVAIYMVTEKDYANPELRGKYIPGKFTNFMLDEADWDAKEGESISADINTAEILEKEKRGLYKYVAPKEEKEEKVKTKVQPGEDEESNDKEEVKSDTETKSDDYYLTANPKDIEVINRKSSTIIRDSALAGGINLFDKLLTDKDKETLKIENWKTVTFAKETLDNRGDIVEVKFRNRYAPFGDKSRKYRVTDGEAFELAKKFVAETKDRIKYE